MKRILNALILILVLLTSISFGIIVKAASGDVYNVVTCPAEDMSTQMQINWQSPTTITGLKVEYTEASDTNYAQSKLVDAKYTSFSRQNGDPNSSANYVGFSNPRHVWNVLLENLTPSTKYIYRITDGKTVYTDNYSFETASATDDEFSFLFMTDPQYYNETGASKFNILAETHIDADDIKFAFITGDISDKGGNSSYWDLFYTKSSLKKIPFATTVGNHEYYDSGTVTTDNVIYNQFFYNPQNGPEHVKGSSYYFLYNGALFIMLDTEDRLYEAEQKEWFKNVCNTVQCNYIIVGCHKSAYPGGPYVSDGKLFIEKWGSIFDECQVDLVLSGHDHMYSRTKSIYAGEITTEPYKGTVYIEGGSAGIKYYAKQSDENVEKWETYFDNTTCATVITVGEKSLKINAYSIGSVDGGKYSPGTLKDTATLARKRFGEIDETFTKEEFEKSITVENAMPDLTSGQISWSEKGYGHVQSITCTHLNSKKVLGSVSFINTLSTKLVVDGEFWIGEINNIKVDILYKDGSTKSLEIALDNNIDWGEILSVEAVDITDSSFGVLFKLDLNENVDYIDRFRVLENNKIKKNYFLKSADLTKDELLIPLTNVLKPDQKYTFEIQAMNVNGTIIWSQTIELKSARLITEEEMYQNDMANLAFKAMIDSLLKALGQE